MSERYAAAKELEAEAIRRAHELYVERQSRRPLPYSASLGGFHCYCGRVHQARDEPTQCECGRRWQRATEGP